MPAALRRLGGSASLAAAALRRLGGSASLAAAARGLHPSVVPRIQAQNLCSEATSKSPPLVQIAETKEELYRLMADNAETIGRGNLGLLKQLAAHVEPRPGDPTWWFYRRGKMINTAMFYSLFLSGGMISAYHRSDSAEEAANKQG